MCQLISNKFAPHLIYRVKTVELKQWTDRPWAVKKSLIHEGDQQIPVQKNYSETQRDPARFHVGQK